MTKSAQQGIARPRLLWPAVAAAALAGCATTSPSTPGDRELASKVKAMSARQAELENKVERLEAMVEAMRAQNRPPAPASRDQGAGKGSLVPKNLATVKVGPQPKKAPPLSTNVTLREPDASTVEQLMSEPAEPGAEADFDLAMSAITTGDVERGARMLQDFADKNPRDERAPLALFQAGMGLLNYGDPRSAALAFERVANDYPRASEAPDAMIRLADCHVRLKRIERAREEYARVMSRYPGSAAAKTAEAGLKNLSEEKSAQ